MTAPLHWTAGLHHDGSALYVSNPLPAYGETVTIRLRAPADAPMKATFLRTFANGVNLLTPMQETRRDEVCVWWAAEMPCVMPSNPYHFKLLTDEGAYYYNAGGIRRAATPDMFDFKLLTDYAAPAWVHESVFYQIFPDRFYNGDPASDVPPGAWSVRGFTTRQRAWGDLPLPWAEAGNLDFYGGDLPGIAQKLDYLTDLGVNALYLTPIFAAHTNHRYDTIDFDHIDPYLGGDAALVELREALDRAGMRLILDITPNHCSAEHPWFKAAQADPDAPSADFFTFYERPNNYEKWAGDPMLPKLNYTSEALRATMYGAPDSIMRRWLREPYRIDGWRLDVQNMVARQGRTQMGNKIARNMRRAVKSVNAEAYLMGENFHDATSHLQGNELDGIMNYQGFNTPARRWLAGYDYAAEERGPAVDWTLMPAEAMTEQWLAFRSAIPWAVANQQFNQLCSHDTIRILTVLNRDRELLKLAVTLLMTYPGVPCIYYGDEIGMEGGKDPDNRRCMRWDEATWDTDLRSHYQHLIRLRKESPALKYGGYQSIYAEEGFVAYLRQSPEQRLLVVGYRGPNTFLARALPVRHAAIPDGTTLVDQLSGERFIVESGAVNLPDLPPGAALVLEG
jgi:alpha-glucosidase